MSKATDLATKCFIFADSAMGLRIFNEHELEAFYHAARAEALREAAMEFDNQKVMVLQPIRAYSAQDICDNTKETYSRVAQRLRAMADREGKEIDRG